ncbi:MAG TPA: iron-containing redox enzyme family protein [Candidatus Binataceae bacterium]|jgi:pyrroloquinoline quinone (PQQ) biosynthesis protein C|nr:iron-containing redox enzyme family protein [Candidatus Binataceae bacterium]
MDETQHARNLIDEIAERTLAVGREIGWFVDPLTRGRGREYLLQHVLRNRLLSAVLRPAWLSRCPDAEVVRKTIGQMRQELVMDDQIGTGHTAILRQMGRNIGLSDEEMETVEAYPLVDAAFQIWENICRTRHWIAGWLTTSLDEFILSTLPQNNFRPENWMRAFGLTEEQVFFFRYHLKADEEHAGESVWTPILRHVRHDAEREEILRGLESALVGERLFYQGICEAGDAWEARHGGATR